LGLVVLSQRRRGTTTHRKKLGTFSGVFVPTVQNILGIIFFVRVPFIVGQAGIVEGLGVVWVSSLTTVLTAMSMSAVATNGVPRGGGAYSVIKNSLGPQFGGVTGILLFLSNVFGVAMYVLGAVEVLRTNYPSVHSINERLLGTTILLGLTVINWVGVRYVARFSILFLSGVVLAVVSIFLGTLVRSVDQDDRRTFAGVSKMNLDRNWRPGYCGDWTFAKVLALFYPAVTDPLAGSNLSGDLADPQGSIPVGTLLAVFTTTIIFTLQVVLVAGAAGRRGRCDGHDGLRHDDGAAFVVAAGWPLPQIVQVGVLVSTLGAGLQSLAGAPRLLAAIAKDNLIPMLAPLAPTTTTRTTPQRGGRRREAAAEPKHHRTEEEQEENPRRALILCAFLSCCAVALKDLDTVAPFITLWFLTCYTIINGTCAHLAYERSVSFRPSFRHYDWRLSLFGVVSCGFLMFYISWYLALGALAIAVLLYKYIETQPAATHITSEYDTELCELVHRGGASPGPPPGTKRRRLSYEKRRQGHRQGRRRRQRDESSSSSPTTTTKREREDAPSSPLSSLGGGPLSMRQPPLAADWRAGLRFKAARNSLLALEAHDLAFKYWRPFVLFLCKLDDEDGAYVPQAGTMNLIAQLMKKGRGLALVNGVLVSSSPTLTLIDAARAEDAKKRLQQTLRDRGVEGFGDVIVATSVVEGHRFLLRAKGLGHVFRPNTVVLGWPHDDDDAPETCDHDGFCAVLEEAHVLGKTVLVVGSSIDFPDDKSHVDNGRVDVWWMYDLFPANGLLLLLPFLLAKSKVWKHTTLRLVVVSASAEENDDDLDATIRALLRAGGVIADLLLLQVEIVDAPRYAQRFLHHHRGKKEKKDTTQCSSSDDDDAASTVSAFLPTLTTTTTTPHGAADDDESKSRGQDLLRMPAIQRASSHFEWDVPDRPTKLAALVDEHSNDAELVLMPLPDRIRGQSAKQWIHSVESLIRPLKRVILVHETGDEQIQFFN